MTGTAGKELEVALGRLSPLPAVGREVGERGEARAVDGLDLDVAAAIGARNAFGRIEALGLVGGDPIRHAEHDLARRRKQVADTALTVSHWKIEDEAVVGKARHASLAGAHPAAPNEGPGIEIAPVGEVPELDRRIHGSESCASRAERS